MRTLLSALLAAQKKASGVPYVKVEVADSIGGVKRLEWQRLYSGSEPDSYHAATMPTDGSLNRCRVDAGSLYRQRVALQDGRTAIADEAYIRRSIVNPDADVVAGFQPIMPSYQGQVTEEEILKLIAFIKALGPGQTPKRIDEALPPAVEKPEIRNKVQ